MSPNFTCHLEMLLWIFWGYPAWVWMFLSDPQDVNPVSWVFDELSPESICEPEFVRKQLDRLETKTSRVSNVRVVLNPFPFLRLHALLLKYCQMSVNLRVICAILPIVRKKCETWPDQPGVNFWFVPLACMDVLPFELWRLHCAIVISLQNCLVILADIVASIEYSAWEKFCQGLLQKFWNSHIIILCITRGENAFVEKFWPENGLSRSRNGCFRACFRDNDLMSESSLEKWSTYSNALMQWFYAFCWVCLGCCVSIRCISLATRSVFAWL